MQMTYSYTVRVLLCATALLVCIAPSPAAALDQAEIDKLFDEGNELFHQANESAGKAPEQARDLYRKAAMRFERIAREGGIQNGKLYYNIGNAYFRMEDIGRAILNYRRAGLYIPNDLNLRQNLEYARSKRQDKIEEKQETKILKTLFFWHYDFSTKTRSVLFALFFVTIWTCALVRLFAHRIRMNGAIAVSAIFALLFFGSLLVEALMARMDRPGVIVSFEVEEVVARKGDSESYEKSFTEPLHAGIEFNLLEARGDWHNIELADGRRCWVPARNAELVWCP